MGETPGSICSLGDGTLNILGEEIGEIGASGSFLLFVYSKPLKAYVPGQESEGS